MFRNTAILIFVMVKQTQRKGMKMIGTILPTKKSLAASDQYAKRVAAEKKAIGERDLSHCDRRVVGGEVRYYDTTDQYAIVSRQGKVIWFAVREDGDYRI